MVSGAGGVSAGAGQIKLTSHNRWSSSMDPDRYHGKQPLPIILLNPFSKKSLFLLNEFSIFEIRCPPPRFACYHATGVCPLSQRRD